MAIVYYVTSHGLGHAVRSSAVIDAIPEHIPVIVRSTVASSLFEREIRRPYRLEPASFDCGVIQEDCFVLQPKITLERYAGIHSRNRDHLFDEVRFLENNDARLVVSDVPSFPLLAADTASIPAVAITNFTWKSIYEPYVVLYHEYLPLLEAMTAEYGLAKLLLKLPGAVPMPEFHHQRDLPLVGRRGQPIRERLAREFSLNPEQRWLFVYLGEWPSAFDGSRLTRLPNTTCISLGTSPPAGIPSIAIDPRRFGAKDVLASCDLVLAKPGYGIFADCIINDRPLVYTPRQDFVEYAALHRDLQAWGRALCLDADQFLSGNLAPALDAALQLPQLHPFPTNGASIAGQLLASIHDNGISVLKQG